MDINTMKISPVNMEDRKNLGIKAGDTVRVWVKIQEKGKTRLQAFEGLVLAKKHGAEAGSTFTVRKVSDGVGVERIFPLYSPNIDKIEIIKRADMRRAKLYYIRDKVTREIKRQMRKIRMMNVSSLSDASEIERVAKEEEAKANAEAEAKAKVEAEAQAKAEAEALEKANSEQPTADSNEGENKVEEATEEALEEEVAK